MRQPAGSALEAPDEAPAGAPPARRPRGALWVPVAAWTVIALIGAVVIDHLGRGLTFFFDEWDFVIGRRAGWSDALWQPHNGHLSVLPVLAYRAMFALVGLEHYRAYRWMGIAAHLAVATLVWWYARRRLGEGAAISGAAVVLFLGSGWQNILWPFQIGFMGSVALGIGAWILLDRKERRADVLAAACLAASLACSGVGIPIVVGTTVRLALTRNGLRRWWVIAGPVLLYGIWYLAYGDPQGDSSNLAGLPAFVWEAARSATAALASGSLALGAVIVIAVAALAVGACVVGRRVPAAVGGTVALLVSDWALTGYARGGAGDAGASRYVYVGAVFVVLLAADSIAELLPLRRYVGDAVRVAFPVLAVLCIWANASTFRSAASGLREASGYVGAELRALELSAAAGTVDPAFHPDTTRIPQIAAGPYLAAVADLGSPAMATVALADQPAGVREAIDRVALGAAGTSVFTPDPADTCTIDPAVTPAPTPLTGAAIVVAGDAPVEIRLIRTAAQPPAEPTATVDPRSRVVVDPPLNPDAGDWTLATTSSAPFAVCSA